MRFWNNQKGRDGAIRALLIMLTSVSIINASLLDSPAGKFFSAGRDEQEQLLEHVKGEDKKWKPANQEQQKKIANQLELTDRALVEVKNAQRTAQGRDADFFNKKISSLNEIHQALFNMQLVRKEITADLESHIKALEEHKKDPAFKSLIIEPRAFYNFDALRSANQKVVYQEDAVAQLATQKTDALVELDNRKKKAALAQKEYQEKKRAQEDFGSKTVTLFKEFNFAQRGELLDLTERFANYEKQVADLKVIEMVRKISLINTKIFLENEKLKILKENLNKIKGAFRVSDTEVIAAREKIEKSKTDALEAKDKLYQEIKSLTAERERLKRELDLLSRRYAVSERDIASWSITNKTPEGYSAITEIGSKNAQIQLLDRKIEYLHAQIDLEDANFKRQEIGSAILSMWQQVTQRRFKSSDEIGAFVKRFKEQSAETQRELGLLSDKRNATTNLLNLQNKEAANLKAFIQEVQNEQDLVFKRYPTRYTAIIERLADSEKVIAEQIENTSRLIEVESNLIATLDETNKELNFVLGELEAKSIWQRSEYAISWRGLTNFFPDLNVFFKDVQQLAQNAMSKVGWKSFLASFTDLLQRPLLVLMLIACGFLLVLLYNYLRRLIAIIRAWLLAATPIHKIVFYLARISGMILFCIEKHFLPLFIWSIFFVAFSQDFITDLFLKVIFYLVSIPFFLYVATRSVRFIIGLNRTQNYPLFGKSFEPRFASVAYIFSYVSIVVLLFREAFIAATIHKSELPTILLATYSLFLRILVIFAIGRKEVVTFISRQGTIGAWISKYINTYYYLLLAAIVGIMIISDPYVGGYGNLISYILWGAIGTVVLAKLVMIANLYIRRFLSAAYFAADDESTHERFAYAKTLYGLSVIALFIVTLCFAVVVATRIWMIPFSWNDVSQALNFQLFDTGVDKTTGQLIYFTPLKLFVVLSFIAGGFILALLINRFVLKLIFDLLPVDLGVQNTVTSILRYLIIVIAIYFGFQWGGLGTLLLAIGVVIGSIGYIVKEPIGDFISYFIILVQRPIQVGDYIMIDTDYEGVVRKITPRSIILRRRDSYTIIVPNSMILSRPINNWNYARNFIGFDDIDFTVPFDTDPVKVKSLILQVLENNPDVLKSPRPVVRLNDFDENGFRFKVRGFVSDVNIMRKWDIASDVRLGLTKLFREHNIKIAVPTRVIITKQETN
ncbi:mechanosensitive ion channel [Candidatus Dependentiae bacterium]|nr:mechanosensitive ion channel [Candidatus Dependentiae bacterium]